MVDEFLRWDNLKLELDTKLSETFSPATPIDRRDFFHGRNAIIRRLMDAANQRGQHAIIYGERGVGKTSLANVLEDFLSPFSSAKIIDSAKVNCSRESTYNQIWNSLFRQVGLPETERYKELILDDVRIALQTLHESDGRKLILIVDEFDRIEDPEIDTLFADTIKALSDFNVDTTLILVGVADDIDDLITEHESINRCLVQIHLPRMNIGELREIVKNGMDKVGIEISEDAALQICSLSLGLPHYVHAFGLASGRSAIDRNSRKIETYDVIQARKVVISESQQTMLRQFDIATASPRRRTLYFQVLVACALAATDELGYFRASSVQEPFSRIRGSEQNISSFVRHLNGLCDDKRGAVLQRFGAPRNYRYRFSDPLMQPYALMRGLENSLLSLDDIRVLSRH